MTHNPIIKQAILIVEEKAKSISQKNIKKQ